MTTSRVYFLLIVLVICIGAIHCSQENSPCKCTLEGIAKNVRIVDDDSLSQLLRKARDDFMQRRQVKKFDALYSTILIPSNSFIVGEDGNERQIWLRGHVDGNITRYPASCVKLNYMLAAMDWCKRNGKDVDCLDDHVRPMIVYSDNYETGFVVDAITSTANIPDLTSVNDPRWQPWIQKRMYTSNLLKKLQLLENEVIMSKTYPTNSGNGPLGAEQVIINEFGRNAMQACCAASLMLYVMKELEPNEVSYAKSMLWHQRTTGYSSFGYSLTPGTSLHNKYGLAYDTVEDIAHIKLPNDQEFILAALSNGFQRPVSDLGILGMFAERVIEYFGLLNHGNVPIIVTASLDKGTHYSYNGPWITNKDLSSIAPDRIGQNIMFIAANVPDQQYVGEFAWNVNLPEGGFYEVSMYTPSMQNATTRAVFTVTDAHGEYKVPVNQQLVSRWVKLGDFIFNAGLHNRVITVQNTISSVHDSSTIVINAVRFAAYPPAKPTRANSSA